MLALAAGTALYAAQAKPFRRWACVALFGLFVLDQRLYLADLNPTRPAPVYEPRSEVIEFLQESPGARFYSRRGHVPAYFLARTRIRRGTEDEVLASFYRHVTPNCALLAGLNDALGYGELDFVGRGEPDLSPEGLKTLSSWGVRFVITFRDDEDLPPGADVVLESEDLAVIEIRPRPYYEVTTLSGARTEVLMRDSYYPGWIAFLDGHRAEVSRQGPFKRAAFARTAQEAPVGGNSVGALFIYEPLSFKIGLVLSLIGVLVFSLVAAVQCCRCPADPDPLRRPRVGLDRDRPSAPTVLPSAGGDGIA